MGGGEERVIGGVQYPSHRDGPDVVASSEVFYPKR